MNTSFIRVSTSLFFVVIEFLYSIILTIAIIANISTVFIGNFAGLIILIQDINDCYIILCYKYFFLFSFIVEFVSVFSSNLISQCMKLIIPFFIDELIFTVESF